MASFGTLRAQNVFTSRRAAAPPRITSARRVVSLVKPQNTLVHVCQAVSTAASSVPTEEVPTEANPVPVFKGDLLNPTYYPTSADAARINKQWFIVDAEGKTLGRLACLVANYIRGKNSPTYTPSFDMGAFVIVINSEKVVVTGKKFDDKTYFRHVNGRPGSYSMESFKHLQARIPERIIEKAVQGMLPKGRLGRDIRLHLKAFKGTNHPHVAQQPIDVTHEISMRPCNGPGKALLEAAKAARTN
jgi:large subunit ribosomal protein L13